jgi:DNA topoisomerase I
MFSCEPSASAIEAGLKYVCDADLSIRRVRRGRSFQYVLPNGQTLRAPDHLKRINSLVIPPAWRDVRICLSPEGYLQAVGWDVRGRKQYRYHPRYRETRDQVKFSRMIAFGTALALIRKAVQEDLSKPGLSKKKVVAVIVRLLESALIRVGNEQYAEENESFGLTTMRNRHVKINGTSMMFRYRGKSGQDHVVELTDRRLASIVKQCRDLPGYNLFEYPDAEGNICRVCSDDVNRYIHEVAGKDFSAKDFRTWAGTVLAVRELSAAGPAENASAEKKIVVQAVRNVAAKLGNRPAVSRKYYIHPAILEAYSDGSLFTTLQRGIEQNAAYSGLGLSPEEYAVMVIVAGYQEDLAVELRKAS